MFSCWLLLLLLIISRETVIQPSLKQRNMILEEFVILEIKQPIKKCFWNVYLFFGLYYVLCCLINCVGVLSHKVVSYSLTLWTIAHQAPLFTGFFRKEYWSGLPFLPPGDLPDLGIKPVSPALAGRFFTTEMPGKPNVVKIQGGVDHCNVDEWRLH